MKSIKTNFLVVSDYNWLPENIEDSWVHKYTNNYLIYDRYHRFKQTEKIKWQDNVGQNIYDIFHFIYNNYDNLPEATIFCRACIFYPKDTGTPRIDSNGKRISNGTCSEEYFQKVMNNNTFTEIHDFGIESHSRYFGQQLPASKFDEDGYGFLEINNSWYFHHYKGKYFNNLNLFLQDLYVNPIIPQYIRFAPGGSYIIPKKNMLKYTRNFYKKIKDYVGWDILTGEAHMLERALYTIFTCDYEVNSNYK